MLFAGLTIANVLGVPLGTLLGRQLGWRSTFWAITVIGLVALIGMATLVPTMLEVTASSPALVSLALMGLFGFATLPGLQMRIMSYAERAPNVASGANIAAFNTGNPTGAWLGWLTISVGLGYTSPIWVGAALTLAVLLAATSVAVRSDAAAEPVAVPAP